jgi:hypothetical protein
MKGKSLAIVAVSVGLLVAAAVYAGSGGGNAGSGGGSYYGDPGSSVNVQSYRDFYKDTASLRDNLAEKEFELQQEYDMANPNPDRISVLRKEIVDLQSRIEKTASKHRLSGRWMRHNGMMWGGGYSGGGCGCW